MGILDNLIGLHLSPFEELWQDREVRFGCSKKELALKQGEAILGSVDDVEDTKAHNGVTGKLLMTNLRLMWWSKKTLASGLSIGYGSFNRIVAKLSSSKLKGATESLLISAKHQERDYDFIFTSLHHSSVQLYNAVAHVYSVYDKTRLYRDVDLKCTFIMDGGLDRLAFEQAHSRVDCVWNLCGGEGDVGSLFVSNIRVVWASSSNPSFNVSIPFNQVNDVKVRSTKFGPALVLYSSKSSGAFTWYFKVEPEETLNFLYKQIMDLWKAYNEEPFYGIDIQVQAEACMEALAAEPTGFSFTSQNENVRSMDSEARGNIVENYFAHSATSPDNSFTSQRSGSPRHASFTSPAPHDQCRPTLPASFTSPAPRSPQRAPASTQARRSAQSFSGPAPRSSLRPSTQSFTGQAHHSPLGPSAYSYTGSARHSPLGPLSHLFSSPAPRPSGQPSPKPSERPTSTSLTNKLKGRESAVSKETVDFNELVYWCNPPVGVRMSPQI